MEPWKRSVGRVLKRDFAEGRVFVEHVDRAELIEIEAEVRMRAGPAGLRGADKCLQAG